MKFIAGLPKFMASDCDDGSTYQDVFIQKDNANKLIKEFYKEINCKNCQMFIVNSKEFGQKPSAQHGGATWDGSFRCAILDKELNCVNTDVFYCASFVKAN